jgi:hypothetical protein
MSAIMEARKEVRSVEKNNFKKQKKVISVSISPVVHEKAQICAERMGMNVSAFISMLIANYKE